MTPNDIDVLLHYHCCCDEHERIHAPAVAEAINGFVQDGILRPRQQRSEHGSSYETTERGVALVELLCRTEYPVQVWVSPAKAAALLSGMES